MSKTVVYKGVKIDTILTAYGYYVVRGSNDEGLCGGFHTADAAISQYMRWVDEIEEDKQEAI